MEYRFSLERASRAPRHKLDWLPYVGKYIGYLRASDMGKHGRGPNSPKYGRVITVTGNEVCIDGQRYAIRSFEYVQELIFVRELGK